MSTNFTVLRQNPAKDKTEASFFCLQKVKEIRERLKNTSFLYIFPGTDKTNYQRCCVQTEGFSLILD